MNSQRNYSINLEIAPINEEAAHQVLTWRNDPETRANSFDTREKKWPQFYSEFTSDYASDKTLPCLFATKDGNRVAFARFRRLPYLVEGKRACDVSVMVAPEHRGKGIAIDLLENALEIVRNARIEIIVADIKPSNNASIKVFESAGYQQIGEIDRLVEALNENVRVKRFIRNTSDFAVISKSKRKIGDGHPCFVIAEAGSNWRVGSPARDLKMAKTLIEVAAEAGADAVKFQTYKAKTTYVSTAGQSDYLSHAGIKESIMDIFEDLSMPYEMVPDLAVYASEQGLEFMSSPFSVADYTAVNPYVNIHKIASYEISHIRLLEAMAASGKVTVLSTGASEIKDIEWAINYFKERSGSTLCLMQCTARYPAPLDSLNLGAIPVLKSIYGLPVGLSDHSRDPITGPTAAVALGANLIEKHYTLDNRLPGPDHAFAVTAKELKEMVDCIRKTEGTIGTGCKTVQTEEEELYWYARRGLQAIANIAEGDQLVEGINFDILRPGKERRGVHPKLINQMSGATSLRAIAAGDGLQEEDIALSTTS